ncbi:tyrosine-type recombinase/integrase [Mesorhizobium sp. M0520]|uniref:tyrosine-type recombinase/integrase n=1 Tax=Mesorhizobium sp. M0520 TaxID=2956957 RepID=UPI003334B401
MKIAGVYYSEPKNRNTRHPSDVVVEIPPELREALDMTPTGATTYLITDKGKPFTIESFGNQFKKWCVQAGLPHHCTAHGVRKAAAADHAEAGASADELKAMFGWNKSETAEIYTRAAEKRRLAKNAARRRREKRADD